jgi:hypothetical protein
MIVPLVQPSKDVEDKIAVRDHAAEVTEGVDHALHLVTIVTHGEVTLDEVAKRGVKMNRAHLVVDNEPVIVSKIQEMMALSMCSQEGSLTGGASKRMWSARS